MPNPTPETAARPAHVKRCYLVMSGSGYWGRGKSLKEAAAVCQENGANKTDRCIARLVLGDDTAEISESGRLIRELPPELEAVEFYPVFDIGTGFKLGQLLALES